MNESFLPKIKIFICGIGSAVTAFLFFMLRRRSDNLSHNSTADDRNESNISRISATSADLRTANEQLKSANQRLENLIESIEKENNSN